MGQEKISFNHKDEIQKKLKDLGLSISEYSFANLYLFRKIHQFEIIRDYDLFIRGVNVNRHSYLIPTSLHFLSDKKRLVELLSKENFLFPIPEQWLSQFDPLLFEASFDQGECDYLFKMDKLSLYPGRKLAAKRNLKKQYLNSYQTYDAVLNHSNVIDAKKVLENWSPNKDKDYDPCLGALQLLEPLELFGKIFYADGKPSGFLIAEKLNEQMIAIHFSKANVNYKGIYAHMFQSFANDFEGCQLYINMEQDLGIESLRKSKLSYQPDKILKKWRISLKKLSI